MSPSEMTCVHALPGLGSQGLGSGSPRIKGLFWGDSRDNGKLYLGGQETLESQAPDLQEVEWKQLESDFRVPILCSPPPWSLPPFSWVLFPPAGHSSPTTLGKEGRAHAAP